jgi:hypothetical protein
VHYQELKAAPRLGLRFLPRVAGRRGDRAAYPACRRPIRTDHRFVPNFAANVLDGTALIAPGSDGINGVRLTNAIHLSSWTGREVPLDFDEEEYLAELNKSEGREVPRAELGIGAVAIKRVDVWTPEGSRENAGKRTIQMLVWLSHLAYTCRSDLTSSTNF